MKVLIPILIGLLVVGCGEVENGAYKHRPKQTDTNESTPTTTEKPAKELTLKEERERFFHFVEQKQKALRDSAVGTYEGKKVGGTLVFLDNGVLEAYNRDGEKRKEGNEAKWKVVDGEIHADNNTRGDMAVLIINKDGSLTMIAEIKRTKRKDIPKEDQRTFKKIK